MSLYYLIIGIIFLFIKVCYSTDCFSVSSLDNNVCSGHGHCLDTNLCICFSGYYGSKCDGFLYANRPTAVMYGIGENGVYQLQDAPSTSIYKLQNASMGEDEKLLFSKAGQQTGIYFTSYNKTFAWGYGPYTGLNEASNVQYPQEILTLRGKYIEVLSSYSHTIISTDENKLYGWGRNVDCQIDSSCTNLNTPTLMDKGEIGTNKIASIACGASITLFLDVNGAVYTQGNTFYSGVPSSEVTYWKTPIQISSLNTKVIFYISAGDEAAHVITTDNLIYGWGKAGLVGAEEDDNVGSPIQILKDNLGATEKAIQVCNGLEHGLLLSDSGFVYGWGFTLQGGIGTGTTSVLKPTRVQGLITDAFITRITCTGYMSVVLDSEGNIYRWGRSASSGLSRFTTPTSVSLIYDSITILNHSLIATISTGQSHILIDTYKIPSCFVDSWVNGSECAGNGKCIADDVCECNNGFGGNQCQYYVCFDYTADNILVCNGQGNCSNSNTCDCNTGYGGLECQYFICYDILSNETEVCSSYGICQAPDLCNCSAGYYNNKCDKWNCGTIESKNASVCSTHGTCISPQNCNCTTGYYGNECEIIQCFDRFTNQSTVCSSKGNCTSPNHCECDTGYGGEECQYLICSDVLSNSTNVCSNHGDCIAPDTCDCNYGYIGNNCQYPVCFGIPSNDSSCSNNGNCTDYNTCNCTNGYIGNICNVLICASGYSNESTVCSSHGNCSAPYTCTCDTGYGSNDCSLPICYSKLANDTSSCSGNGTCNSPDNCSCFDGYGGENCQYFLCYGILSNESTVCSSHGSCSASNNCTCNSGYEGNTCQYPICFDIPSYDSMVCSGNGNCSSVNNCICNDGYGDSQCQYPYCFDYLSISPLVCSSHGICNSPNNCSCSYNSVTGYYINQNCSECDPFYSGSNCIVPYCNDSITCNGYGKCLENNTCNCDKGFTGRQCSSCLNEYSIFPNCIVCDMNDTCSSHGTCNSDETCSCFQSFDFGFYSGLNCSECSEGWSYSNCNYYYPTNFTFSSSGEKLIADYVNPNIPRSGSVACDTIFSFTSFISLGTGVVCKWENNSSIFQIILGLDATVLPGSTLNLLTNIGSSTYLNIPVSSSFNPSSPSSKLSYPSIIGACIDLILDGSASSSSSVRQLTYKFSTNISSLNSFLSPDSTEPKRTIPESGFVDFSKSTLLFTLEVTNFLGISNSTSVLIEYVTSSIPVSNIIGTNSLVIAPLKTLSIVGYATDSCTDEMYDKSQVTFYWEQISGYTVSNITYESQNQKINLLNGVPNVGEYIFRFYTKATDLPYPTYTDVQITSQYKNLIPIIQGGNRIVSSIQNLILDGSLSYDPDEAFDDSEYSYSWSCFDYQADSECSFTISSKSVVTISSGTLSNGNSYRWTLTYSTTNRTSSTSVIWTVQSTQLVYIILNPLNTYISSSKDLNLEVNVYVNRNGEFELASAYDTNILYSWFYTVDSSPEQEIDSSLTKTSPNQRSIIFSSDNLVPGKIHTFRVNVEVLDLSQSASSTISSIVNLSPQNGTLEISPKEGYGISTKFTITTSWSDIHTPLQYQFYYIHPKSGLQIFLSPLSGSYILNKATLPIFSYSKDTNVTVGVIVYDFIGAQSSLSTEILIIKSNGDRLDILNEIESGITYFESFIGLIDLTSLLRQLLLRTQLLLSNEELDCETNCSSKGNCQTDTNSYSYCVCNDNIYGLDCSTTLDVKTKAKILKESTFSTVLSIFKRSEYQVWVEEDMTLLSDILSTLLTDRDEITYSMIQYSFEILQLISLKSTSLFNLNSVTGFIQSAIVSTTKSANYDACLLSSISTDQGDTTQREIIESLLSILSTKIYPGEGSLSLESDSNVVILSKDSFSNYQNLNKSGNYSMGIYYGLSPGFTLPSVLLSNIEDTIDLQFAVLPHTVFPCSSLPSNANYQSHVVLLRFMDQDTKIQISDLEEGILITIPGSFILPSSDFSLICRYYNEIAEEWLTDGCSLISYDSSYAICSCTHTTYFSAFIELDTKSNSGFVLYMIIGSVSVLCILIIIFCIIIVFCFCICCILLLLRRTSKRRLYAIDNESIYENEELREPALKKHKSSSSLNSNISLHPWDQEHRGLPYFMRVYKPLSKKIQAINEPEDYISISDASQTEESVPEEIFVKKRSESDIVESHDVADPKPVSNPKTNSNTYPNKKPSNQNLNQTNQESQENQPNENDEVCQIQKIDENTNEDGYQSPNNSFLQSGNFDNLNLTHNSFNQTELYSPSRDLIQATHPSYMEESESTIMNLNDSI